MGKKRARLSSGRIDQRSAAPGLRRRRDPEFDDYSDGKPERSSAFHAIVIRSRSSKQDGQAGTENNRAAAHAVSLGGVKGAFTLQCTCGWKSDAEERGGPLLSRARDLHPVAYRKRSGKGD